MKGPYFKKDVGSESRWTQWLYGDWLRHSGREAADAPPFELYLNTPVDTAPADLRTEIYLPLH